MRTQTNTGLPGWDHPWETTKSKSRTNQQNKPPRLPTNSGHHRHLQQSCFLIIHAETKRIGQGNQSHKNQKKRKSSLLGFTSMLRNEHIKRTRFDLISSSPLSIDMSSCNQSHCHITEWAIKLAFEINEIGTSISVTSSPASPSKTTACSP